MSMTEVIILTSNILLAPEVVDLFEVVSNTQDVKVIEGCGDSLSVDQLCFAHVVLMMINYQSPSLVCLVRCLTRPYKLQTYLATYITLVRTRVSTLTLFVLGQVYGSLSNRLLSACDSK